MRRVLLLMVVGMVLIAGCAGGLGGDSEANDAGSEPLAGSDGGDSGDGGDGDQANLRQDSADADSGQPDLSAQVDRAIIRTGTAKVEVNNFSVASAEVKSAAREHGGYVSGSDARLHRRGNDTWQTGYVVVRVPSENFSAMLDTVSGQGTVLSVKTETKDVTDKLVDLNARLENLRAERERLRTLYDRANTTDELLRVQKSLSDVQGEIERIEGQKRSLEDRVAFSTLRVELEEPRPNEDPVVEQTAFHEQSPLTVFVDSVNGVVVFLKTVFIGVVALLPWLAVLSVGAGVVFVGARRGVDAVRGNQADSEQTRAESSPVSESDETDSESGSADAGGNGPEDGEG